jgi:hypothetical protein
MNAMLDARIVAASIHGTAAGAHGAAQGAAPMIPASDGGTANPDIVVLRSIIVAARCNGRVRCADDGAGAAADHGELQISDAGPTSDHSPGGLSTLRTRRVRLLAMEVG